MFKNCFLLLRPFEKNVITYLFQVVKKLLMLLVLFLFAAGCADTWITFHLLILCLSENLQGVSKWMGRVLLFIEGWLTPVLFASGKWVSGWVLWKGSRLLWTLNSDSVSYSIPEKTTAKYPLNMQKIKPIYLLNVLLLCLLSKIAPRDTRMWRICYS